MTPSRDAEPRGVTRGHCPRRPRAGAMTWNYRVMRYPAPSPFHPYTHGAHEVYYDDDAHVRGWSEEPVSALAYAPNDLERRMREIQGAFQRPVLDYNDESHPANTDD